MLERNFPGGPINFHCDTCPDGIETETRQLAEALAVAKDEGWRVRQIGGEWVHFCPGCEVTG